MDEGNASAANLSSKGWFRAMRTAEAREMKRANHHAYVLASVIADRGRYHDSFNFQGLELGEALLGDYGNYGLTRQEYRTALAYLVKWHFVTIRPTSKGTVAKLTDTRLFSIFRLYSNQQANHQPTTSQPSGNHQPTTNKISKKDKNHKNGGRSEPPAFEPSPLPPAERISLEKENTRINERLREITGQASQDAFGSVFYTDGQKLEVKKLKAKLAENLTRLGSVI
jgi:hypothetical protein